MTNVPSNLCYPKRKWSPNRVSTNAIWTIQFNDRLGSDNSLYLIHILSNNPKDTKCCEFCTQQMTSDCTKLYSRVTDSLSLPCNIDSCYSYGSCRLIRLFGRNVINDSRDQNSWFKWSTEKYFTQSHLNLPFIIQGKNQTYPLLEPSTSHISELLDRYRRYCNRSKESKCS
jgi:hypothetical protein